jgi:hypothetical protein
MGRSCRNGPMASAANRSRSPPDRFGNSKTMY